MPPRRSRRRASRPWQSPASREPAREDRPRSWNREDDHVQGGRVENDPRDEAAADPDTVPRMRRSPSIRTGARFCRGHGDHGDESRPSSSLPYPAQGSTFSFLCSSSRAAGLQPQFLGTHGVDSALRSPLRESLMHKDPDPPWINNYLSTVLMLCGRARREIGLTPEHNYPVHDDACCAHPGKVSRAQAGDG